MKQVVFGSTAYSINRSDTSVKPNDVDILVVVPALTDQVMNGRTAQEFNWFVEVGWVPKIDEMMKKIGKLKFVRMEGEKYQSMEGIEMELMISLGNYRRGLFADVGVPRPFCFGMLASAKHIDAFVA